jgi:ribosome-associated translation inhibitor RaiA
MAFPLQITFRHMPPSRIFENRIRELARRLEKFSSGVTGCHVVIEMPHQRKTHGDLFDIHITLTMPGAVIVVNRSHSNDPQHANAYVALRDAFNTARRRLQDQARVTRGDVKSHTLPALGESARPA